jgi:hypothetical protein
MWSRHLFGVSGAALAVPLALAVTLAILASGGTFGHLASISQIIGGPSLPRDAGAAPGSAGGTPQLAAAIRSAPNLSKALRGGSVSNSGSTTSVSTTARHGGGAHGTGSAGTTHRGGSGTTKPAGGSPPTTPPSHPQTPVGALLGKVVGIVSGTVGNVSDALAKVLGKLKLPHARSSSLAIAKASQSHGGAVTKVLGAL